MKCQRLFSGKSKKNISNCHLLKFLLGLLSIMVKLYIRVSFYTPPHNSGGPGIMVSCWPSVCLSVHPSVCQSYVVSR